MRPLLKPLTVEREACLSRALPPIPPTLVRRGLAQLAVDVARNLYREITDRRALAALDDLPDYRLRNLGITRAMIREARLAPILWRKMVLPYEPR